MLRRLDLSENEVTKFTEQVKERNMAELFENFVNDIDMSSLSKIALERGKAKAERKGREIGLEEGRKAGLQEGHKAGLSEGESIGLARASRLTKILIEQNRMEDLKRFAEDAAYRENLFREFGI